jgi:hypothetical protein
VQATVAIALALACLLMIPALIIGGLSGAGQTACEQSTVGQPGVAVDARTGIPANYLRLYQATGQRYGLPWNLLAAIGKIESDHGRDPSTGVRSGTNWAGAAGPMQIGVGGARGRIRSVRDRPVRRRLAPVPRCLNHRALAGTVSLKRLADLREVVGPVAVLATRPPAFPRR